MSATLTTAIGGNDKCSMMTGALVGRCQVYIVRLALALVVHGGLKA